MKRNILAIDPGTLEIGYVVVDITDMKPIEFGKIKNEELIRKIETVQSIATIIEKMSSYGNPVGE